MVDVIVGVSDYRRHDAIGRCDSKRVRLRSDAIGRFDPRCVSGYGVMSLVDVIVSVSDCVVM